MKQFKKALALLAASVLMSTSVLAASPTDLIPKDTVNITFKGNEFSVGGASIKVTDEEKPYTENGVLMVPFRKLAEAFGMKVSWSNGDTITCSLGDLSYYIKIGQKTINPGMGLPEMQIIPPVLKGNVTFVAAPLFEVANVKITAE